ncbi:MAG: SpoIIIAH-like family protein [Clostridia bacterium]
MLSKKKKFVILGVMVVLLVVTGYLNIVLNNRTVDVDSNVTSKGSFFATYRDDRQTIRDKEILFYDAIVSSETSSSEAKTIAEQNKLNLIQMMEKKE